LTNLGLNGVYGSLVLGGYDTSKFKPNNLTFDFGSDDSRELLVELNKITTDKGTSLLSEPISMFLDSTVPYIYLPEAACATFESTFGLVWDNATQLYLLTAAQHTALQAQDPKITFTLGNLTSSTTVDITLPYSAFDLTVSYPIVANSTRYFPLKRANDSSQYTLGRTFFQEAYVSLSPRKELNLTQKQVHSSRLRTAKLLRLGMQMERLPTPRNRHNPPALQQHQ
jgi:hypothetical protein